MKFILGKKLSMTQIWDNDKVIAVTPVLAGPCVITQVKTKAIDKYSALQLAFGSRKEKNIKKPQLGHFKKAGILPMHVREFRTEDDFQAKVGDVIDVSTFKVGDLISVTGTSKGRGFQGVVKRHGFKGGRKSHGNKDQLRMPGSIGAKGPAHVFKGTRMGGRMGNQRITIANLSIVAIDEEKNILYIKGAVPGATNNLLLIKGKGELILKSAPKIEESVNQEIKIENNQEVKESVVTENIENGNNNENKEISTEANASETKEESNS